MKKTLLTLCAALLFGGVCSFSHASVIVSDSLTGTPGTSIDGRLTEVGSAKWYNEWPWNSTSNTVFDTTGTGITRGSGDETATAAASLWLPTTYTDSILTVKADIKINDGGTEFTFACLGFSGSKTEGEYPKGPVADGANSILNVIVYRASGGFNGWQICSAGSVIANGSIAAFTGLATIALTYDQINDVASLSISGTSVASAVAVPTSAGAVASTGFQLYPGVVDTGLVKNFEVSVVPEPQVTAMLLLGGAGVLAGFQRRKRRSSQA